MRQKKVQGAYDYIIGKEDIVIQSPEEKKGKWNTVFGNDNDIHIEVGTGKGKFISELAIANPDINYIGIEKFDSVLIRAVEKQEEQNITNLRFIMVDAANLADIFANNEISKVYLNFSDPWPKNRHEKRRLTYDSYLLTYKTILKEEGIVEFKTDNQGLFEYSLTSMSRYMNLLDISLDLHNTDRENIMTEYEIKFSNKGFRINLVKAVFR